MQPDLNLRRQRLAARSSQIVTAKLLGQLNIYIYHSCDTVLCTGRPYFLFTVNRLFQIYYLALLSHTTAVPVCMCVTHHLPFYWFWNLHPFLSHFPTRHTIGLKARTQIAFGGSFELDISEHKASFFRKAFVPSFLKISQPFFE